MVPEVPSMFDGLKSDLKDAAALVTGATDDGFKSVGILKSMGEL